MQAQGREQGVGNGALVGVLCALGASTAFSLNDMGIKFLSGDYPLHQVVLVRATVALLFTMAIFMPLEGGLKNIRTRRPVVHLLRGLCVVAANMTFFAAIAALPLADAVAIFFVAPLLITALLTCHRIFIQPGLESFGLIRRLAQVEQPADARSFQVAQRGCRLR